MDHVTVACIQQRMSIQPTHEEFVAEARRFLRQAQAKGAHIAIFAELAGVMLAPPLISGFKLGFIKQKDQSKQPGAGFLSRTLGRVAGTTAGALGGGFRGSLERLLRKKGGAMYDAYADTFGGLAQEYGLVLVAGSVYIYDEETDTVRNRAYVFDVDGEVLGYQDKFNLAPNEITLASPGSDLTAIETRYGRFGLLIGRDALYPELARGLAIQGVDLLVGLAASPGAGQADVIRTALNVRAEENQLFAAASFMLGHNHLGRGTEEDFYGRSALMAPISLTPQGTGVLLEAGTNRTETIIASQLDMEALAELRESSRFRPRREMHLGNLGPVLAEMYRDGLTIEEALAQRLGGPAEAAPGLGPGSVMEIEPSQATLAEPEEAVAMDTWQTQTPAIEAPEGLYETGEGEEEQADDG
ncbi:MAG: carbon-nitrogen hydrolase family protein [Anaerolineae bacterium]|jgi:predicted amidohydrolase